MLYSNKPSEMQRTNIEIPSEVFASHTLREKKISKKEETFTR